MKAKQAHVNKLKAEARAIEEKALRKALAATHSNKDPVPIRVPKDYKVAIVELHKEEMGTWMGLTFSDFVGSPYPVITSMKKAGAAAKQGGLKKGESCCPQHLSSCHQDMHLYRLYGVVRRLFAFPAR